MTDQELLGIETLSDKVAIQKALRDKIAELDFEIDIERIFRYIHCAQRLLRKIESIVPKKVLMSDSDKELLETGAQCISPETLVAHLSNLYNNPTSRFDIAFWKSSIDSIKSIDKENLFAYCQAIADFLNEKPYLTSEILKLVANAFPFVDFFPDPKDEANKAFWEQYGYIYRLLRNGNNELDLFVHAIPRDALTVNQLDEIYNRLLHSASCYREKKYAQAFNVLAEGIPDEAKPLILWQRKLNILYKAAFIEQEENVAVIFEQTFDTAFAYYPQDEQLIYMRAKFIFNSSNASQAKAGIIEILKTNPDHTKCLFLLGKCYLKLGITRAALLIFENLSKLNPLNIQYVTAAASARRAYIDFCMKEYDPKENSKQFYIKNINALIEQGMFDEAVTLASQAPADDADMKALLLYAKDIETYSIKKKKDKKALKEALSLTTDNNIAYKIKTHYLRDIPSWSEVIEEKEFILNYYNEYPTDAMANYQMGMSFYATTDYEKAYEYFSNANTLDSTNIEIYYNLARAAGQIREFEKAIEYIRIYLQYNKYALTANELVCEWSFAIQDYKNAHLSAKWILSICRTNEFDSKYHFYFTVSLSHYLNTIPKEYHNHLYIEESLDLYDGYKKPETFLTEGNGIKSMYGAAKLCFEMGNYGRCVKYVKHVLKHTTDHKNATIELCILELLPQSLYTLKRYEELIELVTEPTEALFTNGYVYKGATPAYFLSAAHGKRKQYTEQMDWALKCVHCYMKSETPPIDWIENYLMDKFSFVMENDIDLYIIPIGSMYLDVIKTTNLNHIWMSHNMANAYDAFDMPTEALIHHQKCIAYGLEFPDESEEEITSSKNYINTHSTSNSVK